MIGPGDWLAYLMHTLEAPEDVVSSRLFIPPFRTHFPWQDTDWRTCRWQPLEMSAAFAWFQSALVIRRVLAASRTTRSLQRAAEKTLN